MRLFATAAAAVACVCLAVSTMLLADWPQFMGPDCNGISSEKVKLAKTWPDGSPKELWKIDVGPGYGGMAIVGSEGYLLDRKDDAQDVLRCIDMTKGDELWKLAWDAAGKPDHNGSRSTPAVDDKQVYAIGLNGDFYCVDRKTHQEVWKKNILGDWGAKKPGWAVATSPVLYKDLILVAAMGSKAGVVAYKKDGSLAWSSGEIGSQQYMSPVVTTIGGVEQVLAYGNKGKGSTPITGIDAAKGTVLWTFDKWGCSIPIAQPVHVGDGKVFVSGGYGAGSVMFQVAKSEGGWTVTELWRKKSKEAGSQICIPILAGKLLFVDNNENGKQLGMTCLDLDGNIKWQANDAKLDRGGQILADGMIYKLDGHSGMLYLIEPSEKELKVLAKAQVVGKGEDWAPLSISAGRLIVRDHKQLKCLDVK